MRKWHFKVSQTPWTPPIQLSVNTTQPVQNLSLISSCNTLKRFLRWLHHETRALLKASLTMSSLASSSVIWSAAEWLLSHSNTGDFWAHIYIYFLNVSISKCYVILLHKSIFWEFPKPCVAKMWHAITSLSLYWLGFKWLSSYCEPFNQMLGSSQRAAEWRVKSEEWEFLFWGKPSPVEANSPLCSLQIFSLLSALLSNPCCPDICTPPPAIPIIQPNMCSVEP